MSDEEQSNETEASPADAPSADQGASEAPAESSEDPASKADGDASEDDADDKDESNDDDDDESDDKDKKPDKPKKVKINYEASLPRGEAVSYFEAIIGGLRSGRLEFRQDGDVLVLGPPDQLQVEVKAQRKGDKAKVVFELEWRDEQRALEILN